MTELTQTEFNKLLTRTEELEEEVQRLTYTLDRVGIRLGASANLHGNTYILNETKYIQWNVDVEPPLTDSDQYLKLENGTLTIRGGGIDITTATSGARMELTALGMETYTADNTKTLDLDFTTGDVSIIGTITATSGAIGGWTIGTDSLMSTSTTVGMSSAVTAGDDIRFWAGSATPSAAPFQVTESGALTATSATVSGTILSTIFAENTAQLIGGTFIIPKDTGKLPAVGSADTTINFGKTMTVNDHLLIKSRDTTGTNKTEYIKVGTLVSGTTYNVTRDEAAAHATDPAWPDGTPYAVLGQAGNGWISLDATTTPRMNIFSQGANYNDQTEVVRLGDLNGLADYTSELYGLYIGGLATGAHLTADPTNGLMISTTDNNMTIDSDGLSFAGSSAYGASNTIKFYNDSADLMGLIAAYYYQEQGITWRYNIDIQADARDQSLASMVKLISTTNGTGKGAFILGVVSNDTVNQSVLFGPGHFKLYNLNIDITSGSPTIDFDIVNGSTQYNGDLKPYRNSTAYTGYVYVPLTTPAVNNTYYNGQGYDTGDWGAGHTIDLQASTANGGFSLPANIKAIQVILSTSCATVGKYVGFGPDSTYYSQLVQHQQVSNQMIDTPGIINCDANGDIYWKTDAVTGAEMKLYLKIYGYWI